MYRKPKPKIFSSTFSELLTLDDIEVKRGQRNHKIAHLGTLGAIHVALSTSSVWCGSGARKKKSKIVKHFDFDLASLVTGDTEVYNILQ